MDIYIATPSDKHRTLKPKIDSGSKIHLQCLRNSKPRAKPTR